MQSLRLALDPLAGGGDRVQEELACRVEPVLPVGHPTARDNAHHKESPREKTDADIEELVAGSSHSLCVFVQVEPAFHWFADGPELLDGRLQDQSVLHYVEWVRY